MSEYRALFANTGLEVLSLRDVNIDIEVEETGSTYEQNAAIKAEAIKNNTKLLVIADDSGLEIEALDNFPGITSARYASQMGGSQKANQAILQKMQNIENRRAKFIAVIALSNYKNETLLFRGEAYGHITEKEEGVGGFGYDPIFFSDEAHQTFSLLDGPQKNRFSHRGKAVNKLLQYLKDENII